MPDELMRCNFCGLTPLDFEIPRFIQQNNAVICESCVMSCYQLLQADTDDPQGQGDFKKL